jgi:hypothetical protein
MQIATAADGVLATLTVVGTIDTGEQSVLSKHVARLLNEPAKTPRR